MLDYTSLTALAAVVREGSFERAAAGLGVTPSAISQRIRALEERVGTILVVRGQPCTATAIGSQLCAHVARVQLMEDEMVADLPDLATEIRPKGPVTMRVAVNADSLATWFIAAAASFAVKTGAYFDLVSDHESDTAERLRAGEVLAAVTADAPQVQGCRMISLGAQQYVANAAPAFVEKWFPEGIDAASLAIAPALRFDRKDRLQLRWAREVTGSERIGPTHWIPTTQAGVDVTLAGFAWGINPVELVADHIAAGRLVDLSPGLDLAVPPQWQQARIGNRLLRSLTDAVVAAARAHLTQ